MTAWGKREKGPNDKLSTEQLSVLSLSMVGGIQTRVKWRMIAFASAFRLFKAKKCQECLHKRRLFAPLTSRASKGEYALVKGCTYTPALSVFSQYGHLQKDSSSPYIDV